MSKFDDSMTSSDNSSIPLQELQFFQTQPHDCSYLPEYSATTAFLNPNQQIDLNVFSQLADYGFRRSGTHIYKPLCQNCQACVPVRIPVHQFKPNKSQKRTWKRNQDLLIRTVSTIDTDEHYFLYNAYIEARHADGDMYPPSRDQFTTFLSDNSFNTQFIEFRVDDKLIGVSVYDNMVNGLSAVYTYFDADENKRSIGTLAILFLIQLAKSHNLPSVYLGYWIKESPKMRYKSNFRPLELLHDGQWLYVP